MFHVVYHVREEDLVPRDPGSRHLHGRWVFALWLLGWIGLGGLHRFYLGRPKTGLLYLFTLSLFGFGLLWDLVFMPALIGEARRRERAGGPMGSTTTERRLHRA
jgi:TM2 domain-containing membrane protein YozV